MNDVTRGLAGFKQRPAGEREANEDISSFTRGLPGFKSSGQPPRPKMEAPKPQVAAKPAATTASAKPVAPKPAAPAATASAKPAAASKPAAPVATPRRAAQTYLGRLLIEGMRAGFDIRREGNCDHLSVNGIYVFGTRDGMTKVKRLARIYGVHGPAVVRIDGKPEHVTL